MSNEKKDSTDLVLSQSEVPDITQDALEIIESRNKLWERVMRVALAATGAGDWVDQNGKPYLQATGAEKVARRFGVRIFDVAIEREDLTDDKGRYYIYTVTGKAGLGATDVIETIGTCSSRDKFFGTKDKELKKVEDVDMANIKKKAYTNFIGNAITRLLGIRGLTWDDLKKYGISKEGKTQVKYKGQPEKGYAWPKGISAWDFEADNGHHYVYAKLGKHYSIDFLKTLGMKPSDKNPKEFWGGFNEDVATALIEQYIAIEETLGEEK